MKFPSPCGEKVGINRFTDLESAIRWELFPSPCGEKVGINELFLERLYPDRQVSVPLRGKGRDQHSPTDGDNGQSEAAVSVPLRGKGRDQL